MIKQNRGFTLILVLATIAISALLLVQFANYGLNMVATSIDLDRELQLKWGTASCQRVAFKNADKLLSDKVWNQQSRQFDVRRKIASSLSVVLGDLRFEVLLADESARLDINNLLSRRSVEASEKAVNKLAQGSWKTDLRPLPPQRQRDAKEDFVECWGQVFRGPSEFNVQDYLLATRHLTCWSSKLCMQTATDEALLATAELEVGAINATKLVTMRNAQPSASIESLLVQLDSPNQRIDQLRGLLAETSMTQSVLISVSGNQIDKTNLTIRESFGRGLYRYCGFSW